MLILMTKSETAPQPRPIGMTHDELRQLLRKRFRPVGRMLLLRLFVMGGLVLSFCIMPIILHEALFQWVGNNSLAWLGTIIASIATAIGSVLLAWKISMLGFEKYFRGVYVDGRLLVCLQCGYDLHGSKSYECPECGTCVMVEINDVPPHTNEKTNNSLSDPS